MLLMKNQNKHSHMFLKNILLDVKTCQKIERMVRMINWIGTSVSGGLLIYGLVVEKDRTPKWFELSVGITNFVFAFPVTYGLEYLKNIIATNRPFKASNLSIYIEQAENTQKTVSRSLWIPFQTYFE
jgi:hypothetical protein